MSLGVVTAADITSALVRLDSLASQIDRGVQACAKLDPTTRAQWNDWLAGYQKFSAENKDHFYFALGLAEIGDETVAYGNDLRNWNTTLRDAGCNTPPDFTPPGSTDTVGALTWLAVAVGGVYVVLTFGPELARVLKGRRR
jgi:hypothetical protein